MKSLKQLPLQNKKVLVRVDFNVPLDFQGEVLDASRIEAALPTLHYLLSQGCALIIMTHLGRPKKGFAKEFSLRTVAKEFERLLGFPVQLAPDCVGPAVAKMVEGLKSGQVLMLENLRFHEAEEKPETDPQFAKDLASLADFYVNDAFGTLHRAHASVVDVPKLFPGKAAAGFLLEKEIKFLGYALQNPKRPFLALIGGAKISTKIGVLKALTKKVDSLAIGGGMAFTFLKAQGFSVGNSLVESEFLKEAEYIMDLCQSSKIPLLLPMDLVIAQSIEDTQTEVRKVSDGVPSGFQGLDIGPESIELFKAEMKKAQTILWNGPMGVFEKKSFAQGTLAIAETFTQCKAITIAGGGETIAALQNINAKNNITHLSTGGGATLEYLELGTLPGIEALLI